MNDANDYSTETATTQDELDKEVEQWPEEDRQNHKRRAKIMARYTTEYAPGQVIIEEGAGGGTACIPWALMTYERALGLNPSHAWLAQRLLAAYWNRDTKVFLSHRKLARQCKVTRKTVDKYYDDLEEMGYINRVGKESNGRISYDVTGLLNALAIAILLDPRSKAAEKRGTSLTMQQVFPNLPDTQELKTPAGVNEFFREHGFRFDWQEMTWSSLVNWGSRG
jgi:hypothetical protein